MSFVTQPSQDCRKEHKDKSTQSGAQHFFPRGFHQSGFPCLRLSSYASKLANLSVSWISSQFGEHTEGLLPTDVFFSSDSKMCSFTMRQAGWFILMCNVYFFSTQIRGVISPFILCACLFLLSIQPFV